MKRGKERNVKLGIHCNTKFSHLFTTNRKQEQILAGHQSTERLVICEEKDVYKVGLGDILITPE